MSRSSFFLWLVITFGCLAAQSKAQCIPAACINGMCSLPLLDVCECDSGWTGDDCNTDINECLDNNGGCWHTCTNSIGSYTCSCYDGYFLDDVDMMSCVDHDECSGDIDDCSQICNNHVGGYTCSCFLGCTLLSDGATCTDNNECNLDSGCTHVCTNMDCDNGRYTCSCNDGYQLGSDEHTCLDIDECEDNETCDHTCVNSIGSYECECDYGCSLNTDGKTCDDINECHFGNSECDHFCDNLDCQDGQYECSCRPGYHLGSDEHTCIDIDECEDNKTCDHTCVNSIGSYECECDYGCSLNTDGKTCDDINECHFGNSECDHFCDNLDCQDGQYECSCRPGYHLGSDEHTCIDIDECEDNETCDHTCVNSIGSYECECDYGCSLNTDGKTCDDINECHFGNSECDHFCDNLDCQDGQYECSCRPGYHLGSDEHTCIDTDECEENLDDCEQICINNIASYTCDCEEGCTLNGDGSTCTDVNECLLDTDGCNHICTNAHCLAGQYMCSCNEGYYLTDDEHICADINECNDDNGGCDHNCFNNNGSFTCGCNPGYELQDNGFSCVALPCSYEQTDPLHGSVECTSLFHVTDESCTFSCDDGYFLVGSEVRVCQPDATWSGTNSSCPPLECPELEPQTDSLLILPCNNEYTFMCTLSCYDGYSVEDSASYIRTCEFVSDGIVDWTESKTCSKINLCDPNPCQGSCSLSDDMTQAICSCDENYSGDYCESRILRTPELPILSENEESSTLYLYTQTYDSIRITIIADSSIDILPSTELYYTKNDSNVSFTIRPQKEGFFTLEYEITSTTQENFQEPESSFLIVHPPNPTSNYFVENGLSEGIIAPGCCTIDTGLHETYCSISGQHVTLSSSCLWEDNSNFKSDGITFVHTGGVHLPLSIIGIETSLSTNVSLSADSSSSCGQCTTQNDEVDRCYRWDVKPSDVVEMLQYQSLFRTFLSSIESFLPSGITFDDSVMEYSGDGSVSYYSLYNFYSMIVSPKILSTLQGCENLYGVSEESMYVIRIDTDINVNVGNENVEYSHNKQWKPVCFAVGLCKLPQSPLHIAIPPLAQDLLTALSPFESYISADWKFDIHSVSLSSYGVYPSLVAEWFWNGASTIIFDIPNYDVSMSLSVSGSLINDIPRVSFSFDGWIYSIYDSDEKLPSKMWGDFSLQVSTVIEDQLETLLLMSEKENGLFIHEITADTTFEKGASMSLTYSPLNNYGTFGNIFYTENDANCAVNAFVNVDNNLIPQWTSFNTNCLGLKVSALQFPDLTSIVTIPARESYWPSSPDTNIRIIATNNNEREIQLGSFFSIPSTEDDTTQVKADVYANGSFTGVLYGASISLFDVNIQSDVYFTPELSFSTETTIFDHYKVAIDGSASLINPWESMELNIEGWFEQGDGSFLSDLQAYIYNYLQYDSQFLIERIDLAQTNLESAISKVNYYANEVQANQEKLDTLTSEYWVAVTEYQTAMMTLNQTNSFFEAHLDIPLSPEQQAEGKAVCDLDSCKQECQFEVDVSICESKVKYPVDETIQRTEENTVKTQNVEEREVPFCGIVEECYTRNDVKWLSYEFAIPVGPMTIDFPIGIPFPYVDKFCINVCKLNQRIEATLVDVYSQENVSYLYAYTSYEFETLRPNACFNSDSCTYQSDEEPCTTANIDCNNKRKLKYIELATDPDTPVSILQNLVDLYHECKNAIDAVILARKNLNEKSLERELSQQELWLTQEAYNSALFDYKIASSSYNSVIGDSQEASELIADLLNTYTVNEFLIIKSATFSITVISQSSTIVPVTITYDVPFLNATYEVLITVDFGAPVHIVTDELSDIILNHAIESVLSTLSRKRSVVDKKRDSHEDPFNVELRFETNCIVLEKIHNFLSYLNQSLQDAQNETELAIQNTDSIYEDVVSKVDWIIASSANISDAYQNGLVANQIQYRSIAENKYNDLKTSIRNASLLHWLKAVNDYHNVTHTAGNLYCNSLTDCLATTSDIIITHLVILGENRAQQFLAEVPTIRNSLYTLAWNKNISISEAQQLILSVVNVVSDIKQLNYWCARKPNIIQHPVSELYVTFGSTATLECLADSLLPINYRWWKDSVIIPDETSTTLVIANFKDSDSGSYVCEAINDIGSTKSPPSWVGYYTIPVITLQPNTQSTYAGDESGVQFWCDAVSKPHHYWSWYFKATINGEWIKLNTSDSNVLTISKPLYSHEGWYECEAANEYGSVRSEAAQFILLQVTVTQFRYPMQFLLHDIVSGSGGGEEGSGSPDDFSLGDGSSLLQTINTYLTNLVLQTSYVSLENMRIWESVDNEFYYTVYFELSSKNVTQQNIAYQSLEDITEDVREAVRDLEEVKLNTRYYLNEESNQLFIAHMSWIFEVVNGSLDEFTPIYTCPVGQGIHENYILCVSCAPGQYSSGYETQYRSIQSGSYFTVEVPICSECPRGQYQSNQGTTECSICREYYTTLTTSSNSNRDCQSLCNPGTYSSNGIQPCEPCPQWYYQPQYGATKCLSCMQFPSDDEACLIVETPSSTPTEESPINTAPLIIGTAVVGTIFVAIILLIIIIVVIIGIRKKRQNRKQKKPIDEHIVPFGRTSIFDEDTARKQMPKEARETATELKVQNPLYQNVLQMKTVEPSSSNPMEGTTQVTYIDDLYENIEETSLNMKDDEKAPLLTTPDSETVDPTQQVANEIVSNAIEETNLDMKDDEKAPLLTTPDSEPVEPNQQVANEIVSNAINAALFSSFGSKPKKVVHIGDNTPLLDDYIDSDEEMDDKPQDSDEVNFYEIVTEGVDEQTVDSIHDDIKVPPDNLPTTQDALNTIDEESDELSLPQETLITSDDDPMLTPPQETLITLDDNPMLLPTQEKPTKDPFELPQEILDLLDNNPDEISTPPETVITNVDEMKDVPQLTTTEQVETPKQEKTIFIEEGEGKQIVLLDLPTDPDTISAISLD